MRVPYLDQSQVGDINFLSCHTSLEGGTPQETNFTYNPLDPFLLYLTSINYKVTTTKTMRYHL